MTIWRMRIECWITKATTIIGICNIYCSSTATVVARMPLNVTIYVPYLFCHYFMWNMFIFKKCNEFGLYRFIQNDCRGFNNLSYTIHFK